MGCAAPCRKGQHGNPGRVPGQNLETVRRRQRNLRHFLGIGINHQTAVGKNMGPFLDVMRLAEQHQKEAGHQLCPLARADDLNRGAHDFGRGGHGTAHGAIRITQAHQHCRIDMRLTHRLLRVRQGHPFVRAQLVIGRGHLLQQIGGRGVMDVDAVRQRTCGLGQLRFDRRALPHQDHPRHPLAARRQGRFDGARVCAFRQNDLLLGPCRIFQKRFQRLHSISFQLPAIKRQARPVGRNPRRTKACLPRYACADRNMGSGRQIRRPVQ